MQDQTPLIIIQNLVIFFMMLIMEIYLHNNFINIEMTAIIITII